MTETEWKALECYVRYVADEMGLKDWKINVLREPPNDKEHAGECDARFGRKLANITFHPGFRDDKPEEQRQTVVHELLHCHFAAAESVVYNMGFKSGYLTDGQRTMIDGAYMQAHEYAIDGVAAAFADVFDLIDWSATE